MGACAEKSAERMMGYVEVGGARSAADRLRDFADWGAAALGAGLCLLVFSAIATLFSVPAFAAAVGTVTKVERQAQVGGATAVVGSAVQMGDKLSTGPKSRLEVTFQDKTTITLGESATLVVDRYVFNPEQSTGELTVRTGIAAFRMVTGQLGQMSSKKINASTPFGSLAVRGTDFWWGPINNQAGVLMVSSSKVAVSNDRERCSEEDQRQGRCLCAVTLNQSGQGTDIKRSPECPEGELTNDRRCWRCPGLPYFWSPAQISTALSQTNFGLASLGTTTGTIAVGAAAAAGAGAAFAVSTSKNNEHKKAPPLPPPKPKSP
jgi:FecR protein